MGRVAYKNSCVELIRDPTHCKKLGGATRVKTNISAWSFERHFINYLSDLIENIRKPYLTVHDRARW